MAAILREDPPDLTETGKALPPAIERIVGHCLEKNPSERFASARDLAFDLESLSEKSDASSVKGVRSGERAGRRGRAVGAWLACIVAVGAAAFWLGRRAGVAPEVKYQQLTFGHGNVPTARFSPDGVSC